MERHPCMTPEQAIRTLAYSFPDNLMEMILHTHFAVMTLVSCFCIGLITVLLFCRETFDSQNRFFTFFFLSLTLTLMLNALYSEYL